MNSKQIITGYIVHLLSFFSRYSAILALAGSCSLISLHIRVLNADVFDKQFNLSDVYYNSILSEECHFMSNPKILRDEPGSFLQVWIEENHPVFDEPVLPDSESLNRFRDQIRQITDTNPLFILKNQRSQVIGGDAVNVDLVLNGKAGIIREMNCIEGILFSHLTDRSIIRGKSLFTDPTEFLSYVLSKGDFLKIYFYTVDQPGIGGLSVFDNLLEQDLENGWVFSKNLHNHNFFPGADMFLGGVVPGAGDIGAFRSTARRYGATNATITNGFHSIEMSSDDFQKFSDGSGTEEK
jgi:hypothetical protein